jgi:hypothetical protein
MSQTMKTGKLEWSSPKTDYQTFVPQEYCELCFYYEAIVLCNIANNASGPIGYDANNMPHQKASCGTSYVTVTFEDGNVTYDGYESYNYEDDYHHGAKVDLHDVNIPGIATLNPATAVGTTIQGALWQSTFQGQTWHHNGPATITEYILTKPGHPNHS